MVGLVGAVRLGVGAAGCGCAEARVLSCLGSRVCGFHKAEGFSEAGPEDVEPHLAKLAASGKKRWQVAQAEAAQALLAEFDAAPVPPEGGQA